MPLVLYASMREPLPHWLPASGMLAVYPLMGKAAKGFYYLQ